MKNNKNFSVDWFQKFNHVTGYRHVRHEQSFYTSKHQQYQRDYYQQQKQLLVNRNKQGDENTTTD